MLAELTVAGLYTGVHRYTFDNREDKKYLLFDMTHSVDEVHTPRMCGHVLFLSGLCAENSSKFVNLC